MSDIKRCGSCALELPISAFNFRNRAQGTLQSYCRECANAAWRQWYSVPSNKERHLQSLGRRRRRRIHRNKAIVDALKSRPCADCKQRFSTEAMDFDHVESKSELVSKLVYTVSTQTLLTEIAKCEVVCANCHRIRTGDRLRASLKRPTQR